MQRSRRVLLTAVCLAIVAVFFLPALLGTDWMRPVLRGWLRESFGREVDFGAVSVSWVDGVRVSELRVWPSDGSREHSLIEAEALALDVAFAPLLSRRIEAKQVLLRDAVLRLDARALGAPTGPSGPTETGGDHEGALDLPDARVPVELRNVVVLFPRSRVTIESATADVSVTQREILVAPIDALVNGGRVLGTLRIAREGGEHGFEFSATDVAVDADVAPLLAHVSPLLAVGPDGRADGRVSCTTSLRARGTRMPLVKQTLAGDGVLTMRGVAIESDSWVEDLLGYLSVDGRALVIDDGDVPFTVGGGRIRTERLGLTVSGVPIRIGGSVGLDGDLDYILTAAGIVPLRVGGTVDAPKLQAPGLDDVIDIGGAIDKVKDALDNVLGRDDDD